MTDVLDKFLESSDNLYCDLLLLPVDNIRDYKKDPLNAKDKEELTKLIKSLDKFRVLAERMITHIGHNEHVRWLRDNPDECVKRMNSNVK